MTFLVRVSFRCLSQARSMNVKVNDTTEIGFKQKGGRAYGSKAERVFPDIKRAGNTAF